MSKPNVHGLPQHLRKDVSGYFLDYFVQEKGLRKRKRVRLGQIPLTQAKKVLAEHQREIVNEMYLAPDKPEVTFNEAADSFLEYSVARRKSHPNDLQIITRLKAYFGNRPLKSLNPDSVEAFIAQRRKGGNLVHLGKALTGATINRDVACLKSIVRRAVYNGLLVKDPMVGVRGFKEEARDRTLTTEEYQGLLRYSPLHLQGVVQLAYWTGMRKGEVLGLRWDQVDLKNRVIHLEAADTKTQEKREVPLSKTLVGLLQGVPKTLGSPYVFTFKGKAVRSVKTAFRKACRKAGIKDFRFHDLRHCAVTNLRKAGVSDTVIMSISGHKTYAMFKRYNRIDRSDRLDAMVKAERLSSSQNQELGTTGLANAE